MTERPQRSAQARRSAGTQRTAVIIPAKDEQARIAGTVRAAATIAGVDVVVVVDDGSSDETVREARQAGAVVISHARNRGKAAAMLSGARLIESLDHYDGLGQPRLLLFLDADLEDSAKAGEALIA